MLAITYTNQDIINAQQNTNKSLLYPSDYWNDKIAQISIQKPNLNYFTGVINNFNNIDPEGMLETNSITINVDNDVVNYAKGNTQGVIEIPNRIWNTIISNVTFPGKSFFNRLFINVSDVVNEEAINVQDKTIDITTNGTRTVTPDVGYQGLGEVTINTNVPSGVNNQNKSLVIRSNGNSVISPDVGYSGIGNLNLTVEVPSDINNQNKTLVVTSNGSQTVRPDLGYSGIGELSLSVNVPEKRLKEETITINGNGYQEVYPGEGYDGFSSINIETNVPQPSIQQVKRHILTSVNTIDRVLPDEGYNAMKEVDVSVDVSDLLSELSLNITSSDLVDGRITLFGNVMQPSIGWSSYNINVNVSDLLELTKDFIYKVRVYYQNSPVSQTERIHEDVLLSAFTVNNGSTFNVSQGYGYMIVYESGGMLFLCYLNASSNINVNLISEPSSFYLYELGPAKYIEIASFRDVEGHSIINVCEYKEKDEHITQGRMICTQIDSRFFELKFDE